ncbi:hypothetical protein H1R20_g4197, partial [Candolleomyces eurysporus]
MPDADIPSELILEQLEEEEEQTNRFDPYIGNLLVSSVQQTTVDSASGLIAFPMGEAMNELNVSSLKISRQKGVTINPVANYSRLFQTPIQQLVSATLGRDHALVARTYDCIDFLRLKQINPKSGWDIEGVSKLVRADTHGQEVVDMKLRSEQAFLVNELGSLYSKRPFDTKSEISRIFDSTPDSSRKDLSFWRLAFDLDPNSGYLASSDDVSIFDVRAQSSASRLFELKSERDFLTCVEDCTSDGIVRLCSTSRLYWLDRRKLQTPLLSVRHYRRFDRCLSIKTLGATFLTSRKNNLVSIYDVSHSEDELLHMRNEPFGVLAQFQDADHAGENFLSSPFHPEASHAILLKLSTRGSISGCPIMSNETENEVQVTVTYTDALRSLESRSWEPSEGLLLERDHTVLNMFPAYDAIFRQYNETREQVEEEEASQVYDLLDQIPVYFQKKDAIPEHPLTTYDVAFPAGDEPEDPSRSDFLTGSVLNSLRGYRALKQGRLNPASLSSQVPWHVNLNSTMAILEEGASGDLEQAEEPFTEFNLKDDDTRTPQSLRLEKRYREQLEMDLRLSRDVFSAQGFAKAKEVDHTLETMTEALSLGDSPPDVEFGFLRPTPRKATDDESNDDDRVLELGLGVKLLLKDWELGADVEDYAYWDPYSTTDTPQPPKTQPVAVVAPQILPPTAAPPQLLTQKDQRFTQNGPPALKKSESQTIAATSQPQTQSQELDSIKSRLQTTKTAVSIPKLAAMVYREEGIMGFYRGLWIPLMTISFVRAASFTIYSRTKEYFAYHDILYKNRLIDVALTGGISGAMSGALISFGSAPFELVKVRRQLEYSIAAAKGITLRKPPGTMDAVREIYRINGLRGLYIGFPLHFIRDTSGTALYFLEYDGMRHLLGRNRLGEQGETPPWLPIHHSLVPFVCGSLSGVTSWAIIYPLDVVKTKVQQRALAGERYRGPFETLHRLLRGASL